MKTMEQRVIDLSEKAMEATTNEQRQTVLVKASDLIEELRNLSDIKLANKLFNVLSAILDDMGQYVDYPGDYVIQI